MDKDMPFDCDVQVDCKERVLQFLRTARIPISETTLRRHLMEDEYTQEQIEKGVADLMNSNEIRWVAFRGYMVGGRPE